MLKWLFFDVGNVIVNNDPAMAFRYRTLWETIQNCQIHEKQAIGWEDLLREREQLINVEQRDDHLDILGSRHLPEGVWVKRRWEIEQHIAQNGSIFQPVMPEMMDTLRALSQYMQLGIITDQSYDVYDVLASQNILDMFTIRCIGEVLRLNGHGESKFEWALSAAKAHPEECVYVGDRVGPNFAAANKCDIRTILAVFDQKVKRSKHHHTLDTLFYESVARANANLRGPSCNDEIPVSVVYSPGELRWVLKRMK